MYQLFFTLLAKMSLVLSDQSISLHPSVQVVADTNISAIATQLESMSAGCNLNSSSEHPSEDPE